MEFTSAQDIRNKITFAANNKAAAAAHAEGAPAPDPRVVERFIEQRIAAARAAGELMSDRQWADHKARRTFAVDDYAKYVGPDREEKVGNRKILREQGQRGKIVDVTRQGRVLIFTFRPLADPLLKDQELVELVVRQGTPGFLDIERMTDDEAA